VNIKPREIRLLPKETLKRLKNTSPKQLNKIQQITYSSQIDQLVMQI